jgi:hypothetical protein
MVDEVSRQAIRKQLGELKSGDPIRVKVLRRASRRVEREDAMKGVHVVAWGGHGWFS